jgi:hypothetical protein
MRFFRNKVVPFIYAKAAEAAQLTAKAQVAILTVAVLAATSSTSAMAAGGFASFFTGWTTAAQGALKFFFLCGVVVGVGFVLLGVVNLAKKGGERGDDIGWSRIIYPIIGGGCASVLLYIMSTTVETGGGSAGDIGKTL